MGKIINKTKLILLFLVLFVLVTGVIAAGNNLEEKDEEFMELLSIVEQYSQEAQEVDFETYLSRYDAEVVGFTNLQKGRINPQQIRERQTVPLDHLLVYNVRPGDSLYKLARDFETTVGAISRKNELESDLIIVGQKLYIPFTGSDYSEIPDDEANLLVYTVERGDSLYLIAREFETTIGQIKEENNLEDDRLHIGQVLYIPLTTPGERRSDDESGNEDQVYTVQPGDSLYMIARRFNITVQSLIDVNDLETDIIYPGQELKLLDTGLPDIVLSYEVESQETLADIARSYGIEVEQLYDFNNLQEEHLEPGSELRLPIFLDDNLKTRMMTVDEEEKKLLVRAVHSEARGEPFKGQVAVAAVVLNRVEHDYFPDNIEDVIFEPWQFTAVHDGQFWLEPKQQSFVASRAALEGWDPSLDAIFYYNPRTAESDWVFYRNVVIKIGQHYFAV